MFQIKSLSNKLGRVRSIVLICAAIALWVGLPFIMQFASTTTQAQAVTAPGLVANLTGASIGGATPRGFGSYYAITTVRQLAISVSNVNLPAGTQLAVSLNSSPIGTITLDPLMRGSLMLSTSNGGNVPTVIAGNTLTLKSGGSTILTGTFAALTTPSPTPSQTPTPSPSPSATPLPPYAFAARLTGTKEVPPVTTDGQGSGFILLNSAETQIRVHIGFWNLSSAATVITIKGPATASENGPVIFTLTLPSNSLGYTSQTFDVTAEQVRQLRGRLWYFQVATSANPTGEIRGQLNPLASRSGGHLGGGSIPSILGSDDAEMSSSSVQTLPIAGDCGVNVTCDFDDNGIADIAFFRTSDNHWYTSRNSE